MEYENEDELKQQKMEEMKKKMLAQQQAEQQRLEAESQISSAVRQLCEEAAYSRLYNVKLVNRELYMKAVQSILSLAQQGYIKSKVTEPQMKQLLEKLSVKREIKIKRR